MMIGKGCLFLFLSHFVVASEASDSRTWHWTWTCVNETCVKRSISDEGDWIPLNFCKLSCGKYGSLWPMPTGPTTLGDKLVFFHPSSVHFEYSNVEGGLTPRIYLQEVARIFQRKLFSKCAPFACARTLDSNIFVSFKVISPDLKLNWETDESYALDISPIGIDGLSVDVKIKSRTVYGARHALETLNQLTTGSLVPNQRQKVLAAISEAKITDSPSYPHRGLVLDTARHFISVGAICKTLDAMAMTKLNVLHWHVTDSQSFPLEIPRLPQLCRYGAYSPDQIYTVEDTISIIDYARHRGVRVIIEIDGPAHAGNGWQWGEDENLGKLALCVNQQPWRQYCIQPPCGQLNPVNGNVYAVLKEIFKDVTEIVPPGEVFHMGGDEVYFPCWNSSAEVVQWMIDNEYKRDEKGFLDLWGEYQRRVLQAFDESNSVPDVPVILWSSSLTEPAIIEKYLNKTRYVIETWLEADSSIPRRLLDKGYRLIMSTKDKWYLDHGFWGNTVYHTWKDAYNNRLPKHANVLGGEAAMWSERVDGHSLDAKIWPRTAAVGERLWTDPKANANKAEARFENFREILVQSGINADATSPYYCYQNEQECA